MRETDGLLAYSEKEGLLPRATMRVTSKMGAQRAGTTLYGKRGGNDIIFIVKELRAHGDDYAGVLSLLLERCNLFL